MHGGGITDAHSDLEVRTVTVQAAYAKNRKKDNDELLPLYFYCIDHFRIFNLLGGKTLRVLQW